MVRALPLIAEHISQTEGQKLIVPGGINKTAFLFFAALIKLIAGKARKIQKQVKISNF